MSENSSNTVHKSVVITQLIGIFGFVLIPALITWIAPVSRLTFEKAGQGVRATVRQYVFFVVPFRTDIIQPVTKIEDRVRAGRHANADERRRGQRAYQAGDGTLTIVGPTRVAAITVAPTSLPDVAARARAFLERPADQPLQMTVVANWVVSVAVGGVGTGFALLYLIGSLLAIAQWMLKKLGPGSSDAASTESGAAS